MTADVRETIAAEVRAELARQNKTQRDVAEIIGVDQSSVWQRLTGKRAFRAEELALLGDALGVPVSQFYGASATPPSGTPAPSGPPSGPRGPAPSGPGRPPSTPPPSPPAQPGKADGRVERVRGAA